MLMPPSLSCHVYKTSMKASSLQLLQNFRFIGCVNGMGHVLWDVIVQNKHRASIETLVYFFEIL